MNPDKVHEDEIIERIVKVLQLVDTDVFVALANNILGTELELEDVEFGESS
jgi:hypothetical protein